MRSVRSVFTYNKLPNAFNLVVANKSTAQYTCQSLKLHLYDDTPSPNCSSGECIEISLPSYDPNTVQYQVTITLMKGGKRAEINRQLSIPREQNGDNNSEA
jgi:hypothetical protein